MLILSRRVGETIIIGDGENKIVVKVLDIRGKQARLGFAAPKNIAVHRDEIHKKIQIKEKNK